MASCNHCGAPLAANTNLCKYCGTRNDVDLRAQFPYRVEHSESSRICPVCDIALQTIKLIQDEDLFIERCNQCFGMFFDRHELEHVLAKPVSNVSEINREHIDNINKDRYRKPDKIEYLKCPECRILMNRSSFGQRSGVVVDRCLMHGVWLENGELIHLLEWKKAGGQLLHAQAEAERKAAKKPYSPLPASGQIPSGAGTGANWESNNSDWDNKFDIVGAILYLIANIFFE
jgi:Zn-finger nucleic acid-binding protein